MPAKRDPADILDAILARAPRLHAAGIQSLIIDGLSVTLVPPPAPLDLRGTVVENAAPPDAADPLMDAATYGGGRVPGFQRPKKDPSTDS